MVAVGLAPYAAAKAAANSLTRTLAAELACFRVRVNVIVCGAVLTPGLKDTLYPTPESQADAVKNVLMVRSAFPKTLLWRRSTWPPTRQIGSTVSWPWAQPERLW